MLSLLLAGSQENSKRLINRWKIMDNHFECIKTTGSNGGAIYTQGDGQIGLYNCVFTECSTTEGDGGAAYFQTSNGIIATIENNCFYHCISKSRGGAMFLSTDGKIYINSAHIEQCGMEDDGSDGVVYCFPANNEFRPFVIKTTNLTHSVGTLGSLLYVKSVSESNVWQVNFAYGESYALFKIGQWDTSGDVLVNQCNLIGSDVTEEVLVIEQKAGNYKNSINVFNCIIYPFPLPGAVLLKPNTDIGVHADNCLIDSRLNTTSITIKSDIVSTAEMGDRTYISLGRQTSLPPECYLMMPTDQYSDLSAFI